MRSYRKTTYPSSSQSSSLVNAPIQLTANPGDILYLNIENPHASDKAYVQFFDALAVDVVLGTTKPRRSIVIPGGSVWDGQFTVPMAFDTAITIAATTTREGSTTPSTALIVGCIDYLS